MTDHQHDGLAAEAQYERARLQAYDEALATLRPLMQGHPERTVGDALALLDPEVAERVRAALPDVIKVQRR